MSTKAKKHPMVLFFVCHDFDNLKYEVIDTYIDSTSGEMSMLAEGVQHCFDEASKKSR
jgi:hypothetical protein